MDIEERIAKHLKDLPGNLVQKVRTGLSVPQVGGHHNEGPFMRSHLNKIFLAMGDALIGMIPLDVPTAIANILVEMAQKHEEDAARYVLLHDICKMDCLTLNCTDGSRPVTWDDWSDMMHGDMENKDRLNEAVRQYGIQSIGYHQTLPSGESRTHGEEGARILRGVPGLSPLIVEGIARHEVAYQFENVNPGTFDRHFGKVPEGDIHFLMLCCYLDTAGTCPDGKNPDMRNFVMFVNSYLSWKTLQEARGILKGDPKIDPGRLQKTFSRMWNDRKVYDHLPFALAEMERESRIPHYDVIRLRDSLTELVKTGDVSQEDMDLLIHLASSDVSAIGRTFGAKMKIFRPVLTSCEG